MADLWKERDHSAWFGSDQVDVLRPSVDHSCGSSSASGLCSVASRAAGSRDGYENPRRSFRHGSNLLVERKAYPLPHPMQFERLRVAASPSSDPTDGSLHPIKERIPSPRYCPDRARVLENTSGNFAENEVLGILHEQDVAVKKAPSRLVVVYNGEKKFTTAPLDVAIKGYATSEGDAIVVVAFLEHILSPMGMKMVADMEQFSGVNDAVLKQAVSTKKMEIESKLREASRLQLCQVKKIHLDVKVLPGSNSKALVAKEILAFEATSVIFDKNAMKNRKYFEENLSCHVLRLRSDGRRVETVSLFGQRLDKAGSLTSSCSDSSSGSQSSEPACNSPSIWSKLNSFVSKSRTGQLRHGHGGHDSTVSSSRTSSESGSPRAPVRQEEEEETASAEALEESFSFDTPSQIQLEHLKRVFPSTFQS